MQFYEALQQRLSQVPGVRAVGAAVTLPIGGDDFGTGFRPEGLSTSPTRSAPPRAGYQVVTPGYFAAMGIPLKADATCARPTRARRQPVVLVNEAARARDLARPGSDRQAPQVRPVRRPPGRASSAWSATSAISARPRRRVPRSTSRTRSARSRSWRSSSAPRREPCDASCPRCAAPWPSSIPRCRSAGLQTMDEHLARSLSKPRFFSTLVTGVRRARGDAGAGRHLRDDGVVGERAAPGVRDPARARRARSACWCGWSLRKALLLAAVGDRRRPASARARPAASLTGLLFGIQPTDPSRVRR